MYTDTNYEVSSATRNVVNSTVLVNKRHRFKRGREIILSHYTMSLEFDSEMWLLSDQSIPVGILVSRDVVCIYFHCSVACDVILTSVWGGCRSRRDRRRPVGSI